MTATLTETGTGTYEKTQELRERYQAIVIEVATANSGAFFFDPEVKQAREVLCTDPLCERPASVLELANMILWSDSFDDDPADWSLTELVAREGGLKL